MMIFQYSHTEDADDDGSYDDVIDDASIITQWCWQVDDSEDVDVTDDGSVFTHWCWQVDDSEEDSIFTYWCDRRRFNIHILMLENKVQKMI